MADLISLSFSIEETETDIVEANFQVGMGDAFSEVHNIQLLYWKVGGDQNWISLTRNTESGLFEYTEVLNRFISSGDYEIRTIRAYDNFGDEVRFTQSAISDLGFNTDIELQNSKSDNTPPTIDALNIGEFIFDEVQQKWSIQYQIEASDDLSGLQRGHIVEFLSPTGTSLQEWRQFDDNGTITTVRYFEKYIAEGNYDINTIRLWDNAGNYTDGRIALTQFGENEEIYLINPYADNSAPELEMFDLGVTYSEEIHRPAIIFKFSPLDEGSGYSKAYIRLWDENTHHDRWITEPLFANGEEISFQLNLTQEFIPGSYNIGYFNLYDQADNMANFDTSTLSVAGFPSSINVYFKSIGSGTENVVVGSSTDDWIFGDNFDDVLIGASGDDVLFAGDGNDAVDGGAGDDLIIGGSGRGDDQYDGGLGTDTVKYTSATNGIIVNLSVGYAKSLGTDALIGEDILTSIENIVSSEFDDILIGSMTANEMIGGAGNDSLDGGEGNDTLVGGDGSDTFVFRPGFGNDIITDFIKVEDALIFYDTTGERIDVTQLNESRNSVGDAILIDTDGSSVTLQGISQFLPDTVDMITTVISRSGTSLSDVALSFDDGSDIITVNTNESGLSTASITSGSDLTVTGSLDYAQSSKSVTSQDALDALRLSVGMDTQSGTSSAFDYIAADFNQDGKVSSQDALAILKYAVGLTTTEQAEWVFVDGDGDYSDISRTNTHYAEGIIITDLTSATELSLTGILIGDLNDSYSELIA